MVSLLGGPIILWQCATCNGMLQHTPWSLSGRCFCQVRYINASSIYYNFFKARPCHGIWIIVVRCWQTPLSRHFPGRGMCANYKKCWLEVMTRSHIVFVCVCVVSAHFYQFSLLTSFVVTFFFPSIDFPRVKPSPFLIAFITCACLILSPLPQSSAMNWVSWLTVATLSFG